MICSFLTLFLATAVNFTPQNTEVVVPKNAKHSRRVVYFAAQEMTNFLSRVFGTTVPIKHRINPEKCSIVLGSNDWSIAVGIDTTKLPRDGFALKTKGNVLYVAGTDDNVRPLSNGGRFHFQRATLFGVYEFLERFAGCRFYFPGDLGEIVPRAARIEVPELDEICAPAWTERSISDTCGAWFDPAMKTQDEYLKERYRLRMETRMLPCCHGQYKSKIVRRFGKIHPEYFSMDAKGRRIIEDDEEKPYSRNAQLCYTSDVWEEIYRDARSYFRGEGPEVRGMIVGKNPNYTNAWGKQASCGLFYDIMPHDGMCKCACLHCTETFAKAKDPANYANETVWGWTAKIAQRLKDEGLKGYVTQMAYAPYGNVPDFKLPDNVIVTVCNNGGWVDAERRERDFLRVCGWVEAVGKVKLYNNTGKFRCFNLDIADVPSTTPFAVAGFYNRVSPYIRGAFFSGPAERFIYSAMNYYVFSRIAWAGKTDVAAIMEEYYRLMFGAGAVPMRSFFEELERKWMNEVLGRSVDTAIGTVNLAPSDFKVWTELYSPKEVARLAMFVDSASVAVPADSMEARRIALMRHEYLDPMMRHASEYNAGLSVEAEKARRAANPKPSLIRDFKPVTITVAANETNEPFKAVKFSFTPKRGQWYRISYFVKGENVNPLARRGGAQAVTWQNEAMDKGWAQPNVGFEGTFDWIHHAEKFWSSENPDLGFKPEIDLRLFRATGTATFDGLIVEETTKDGN